MGCYGISVVEWAIVLTIQDMNFISYKPTQHETTLSPMTELTSIGCEAWIDLGRFYATKHSLVHATGTLRTAEDRTRSTLAHGSLIKSFALLQRKLRRGFAEGLG